MIRSMTGYARVETQGPYGRLSWELRSVNHRYFDLGFRMPEDFRMLESELRLLAAKAVSRGKLEASLRFNAESAGQAPVEPDLERVKVLRQALERVTADWGAVGSIDPLRLLSFPGVLREAATDLTPALEAARTLFSQLLSAFNDSRGSEGQRLGRFLEERCEGLEVLVAAVRERYAQIPGLAMERLRTRVRDMGVELEPGRLEQEMVLALQRLDVEEEMSRLLSHLAEVRAALARQEAVGRRLDFLMQELNREANTLSSKSQDAEMTRMAVDMKVLIEQMREQVQNIE